MKHIIFASVLCLLPATALAQKDDITPEGAARTISLFLAIQDDCPKFYEIAPDFNKTIIENYRKIAFSHYGPTFEAIYNAELARRKSEIEITGAKFWCMYQYGYQKFSFKNKSPMVKPLPASSQRADEKNAEGDPAAALTNIASLMDRRRFPDWDRPSFATTMQPYLTRDFIATVNRGGNIAQQKRYNIWDGDLISGGAQSLVRFKLWHTKAVQQSEDSAIIDAAISWSDTNRLPNSRPQKPNMRYWLKKEDNAWKIDDLKVMGLPRFGPGLPDPSVKELFSDPDKYKAMIQR